MKRNYLLLALLMMAAISCKNKQISATESKPTIEQISVPQAVDIQSIKKEEMANEGNTKSDTASNQIYSMVVSFYSIGSGIDIPVAQEFDYFIKDFQEQHGDHFSAERVPWGREGELDYCIQFPSLSQEKIAEFKRLSAEITSKTKYVHVKENTECKRRRKVN